MFDNLLLAIKNHDRRFVAFCHGFLVACVLFVVGVLVSSCRGFWSVDNETKVNGVGVSTHITYSESSVGVEENKESEEK